MTDTRILILEPRPLSQQLQAAIARSGGAEIVAVTSDDGEALGLMDMEHPEVLIIDLPDLSAGGGPALRQIRARYPQAAILARLHHPGEGLIFQAIEAGVLGFIRLDSEADEIITAIQTVRDGKPYLSPEIADRFVKDFRQAYREDG